MDIILTPELLFVVGLPGSGKTPRLQQLQAEGWQVFDDYKANAYANDSHFCAAQRYCELLEGLRSRRKCVVADIAFCRSHDREQAILILHDALPGLIPQWEFFENDVRQCSTNIHRSDRPSASRMQKLTEIASQYFPPNGVPLIPVWREDA